MRLSNTTLRFFLCNTKYSGDAWGRLERVRVQKWAQAARKGPAAQDGP